MEKFSHCSNVECNRFVNEQVDFLSSIFYVYSRLFIPVLKSFSSNLSKMHVVHFQYTLLKVRYSPFKRKMRKCSAPYFLSRTNFPIIKINNPWNVNPQSFCQFPPFLSLKYSPLNLVFFKHPTHFPPPLSTLFERGGGGLGKK